MNQETAERPPEVKVFQERRGTIIQPKLQLREKLRKLRENSGYTQSQVAKILNCSRSTYTYYETGKSSPDLSTLVTLSKIYNVSIESLLAEEGSVTVFSDAGKLSMDRKNSSHIYELSADEMLLIGYFRAASSEEKEELLRFAQNVNCEKKENKGHA